MLKKRKQKVSSHASESEDYTSLQNLMPIVLLKPELDNGKTVLKALKHRKTIREISDKKMSLQMLSNLLWAACGVNRKKGPFGIPGRTAATASNSQEIDLYVALKEGIYSYDAFHHRLIPVVAGDFRTLAIGPGQENSGDKAPVSLIYVADVNKLSILPVTRNLACRIRKFKSHITM